MEVDIIAVYYGMSGDCSQRILRYVQLVALRRYPIVPQCPETQKIRVDHSAYCLSYPKPWSRFKGSSSRSTTRLRGWRSM